MKRKKNNNIYVDRWQWGDEKKNNNVYVEGNGEMNNIYVKGSGEMKRKRIIFVQKVVGR